jgi:hypothetical protein
MQQASHYQASPATRRAAQVLIVILAIVGLLFASCMLVTAGESLAALPPGDQGGPPQPGPTAPTPPTI